MKAFFRNPSDTVLLSLLCAAALAVRLVALFAFADNGGDGPARAVWGYSWSESPHWILQHIWLPIWVYLTGLANFVFHDPVNSGRILNVLLGTATVAVCFFLLRRVFDRRVAVVATIVLAALPIHVSHSATTLGEVPLVFGSFAGMLFTLSAARQSGSRAFWYLAIAVLTCTVATGTRYESWLLVPLLPAWYFWQTRKAGASFLFLAALSAFPLSWMTSNYLLGGSPLPIYDAATTGGGAMGFLATVSMLVTRSASILGWPLYVAGFAGLLIALRDLFVRPVSPEQKLYLFVTCFILAFTIKFTFDRGSLMMLSRYFIFAFTLLLPYAAVPFARFIRGENRAIAAGVLFGLVSAGLTVRSPPQFFNLMAGEPAEFRRLADWLNAGECRDDAVLMTAAGGRAWYLQLYDEDIRFGGHFPHVSPQYMIVEYWVSDEELRDFVTRRRPALLVTTDIRRDERTNARLEDFLGIDLAAETPIHTDDYLRVFRLRPCGQSPAP